MAMWNPWRYCHKYSDGCKFCYIHKGDLKRGVDTNKIVITNDFYKPLDMYKIGKNVGKYKIESGKTVYMCFSTDFLIEEADCWRDKCWNIIDTRKDLKFIFLTKRIDRLESNLPDNWGNGYDNVTVGCTIENKLTADYRLKIFDRLPIKHKNIICQPLIEEIDISKHLKNIELVVVGGESDVNARPLNYDWVIKIRQECIEQNVKFEFRQCGTNFIKDGKYYKINKKNLFLQAKKANINT